MFQRRDLIRFHSAFKDHLTFFTLKSCVVLLFFSCLSCRLLTFSALPNARVQRMEQVRRPPRHDHLLVRPLSPPHSSFFIITSALGVGYGDVYPRTFWGKVLLLALYLMIVIFVPKNVGARAASHAGDHALSPEDQ